MIYRCLTLGSLCAAFLSFSGQFCRIINMGNKDTYSPRNEARNPSASGDTLTILATDDNWRVRWAVAGNQNTPVEVLNRLAEDENWEVRFAVAKNPKIPPEAAIRLSTSEVSQIRQALSENPSVPEHIRVGLSL